MNAFWYKAAALCIALLAVQLCTGLTLLQFDRIRTLNTELIDGREVIFLGDSIPDKVILEDDNQQTIPEMVAEKAGVSVGDFSFPAYAPSVFDSIVTYLSRQKESPYAVIVPVNLSTFANVYRRPEYQFEKDIFYYTADPSWLEAFYRPLAISRFLNAQAGAEDPSTVPVFYGQEQHGTLADFDAMYASTTLSQETKAREVYEAKYTHALEDTDRQVLSLRHLLQTARGANIAVYLYITPMDTETGTKLLGADFTAQAAANADFICSIAKAEDVPCLNLAFAVPHTGFLTYGIANEHLNESGRSAVAERIVSTFFGK